MAYDVEIIEFSKLGGVPGGFPVQVGEQNAAYKFTAVAAAGRTTLQTGTRFVLVRNRSGSQAINVLVEGLTGAVNASAANSPTQAVSVDRWFALPKVPLAGGNVIDIR